MLLKVGEPVSDQFVGELVEYLSRCEFVDALGFSSVTVRVGADDSGGCASMWASRDLLWGIDKTSVRHGNIWEPRSEVMRRLFAYLVDGSCYG